MPYEKNITIEDAKSMNVYIYLYLYIYKKKSTVVLKEVKYF